MTRKARKLPSIRGQSMLVLALILLLLSVAAVDSVNLTMNYALTKQNEENRHHYMAVSGNFQIKANAIQTLMTSLSFDSSVQQVLISRRLYGTSEGWDNFLKTLFSYSRLEDSIDSVTVADDAGTLHQYQYYQDAETFQSAIERAVEQEGYSPCFSLEDRRMFTISQPIYRLASSQYADRILKGTEIGQCIFIMDFERMQRQLEWHSLPDGHVMCILDAEGNVIAQNRVLDDAMLRYIGANYPARSAGGEEYTGAMQQDNKQYAVYSNQLGGSGWTLVCFSRADIWSGATLGMLVRMVTTWLVVILLTFLLTNYLFRNIYGFVAHIQTHMRQVSEGHMDKKMPAWKKREFAQVSSGFNEMMDRINQLTVQNLDIQAALYREEVDKRQVALVALQSQVNPHFLYNTLECVKSIGLCHGVQEIPVICASLAQLMRYSIKGGALSSLSDELASVRAYLSIQNIRFDDRYQLHVQIPDELLASTMLKMLLQPLVENAVLHGFGIKPGPDSIWIEAQRTNENLLCLTISDDGCGMDEQALRALREIVDREVAADPQSTSIGLPNVAQRLRLYYGNEGSLRIHSAVGQGTVIEIIMPLVEGGVERGGLARVQGDGGR